MDWKDTIIVTLQGDRKGKAVIPRTVVKAVTTTIKRDYSGTAATDKEICILHVDVEYAEAIGMDLRRSSKHEKTVGIEVETDIKIVLALLRGDPAAEILF